MPDYISREAALSEVCHGCSIDYPCEPCEPQDCEIKARLEAIPAADVEPVRHAHWYIDDGCAYCSNCRNNFKKAIMEHARFCPMCGVKMDGGQGDV